MRGSAWADINGERPPAPQIFRTVYETWSIGPAMDWTGLFWVDGLSVPVDDLPVSVLSTEDRNDPEADGHLPSGLPELDRVALDADLVCKLGRLHDRDALEGVALAATDLRGCAVDGLQHLVEAFRRRP